MIDKYKEDLLNKSKVLDLATSNIFEIKNLTEQTLENPDKQSIVNFLKTLSGIVNSYKEKIEIKLKVKEVKESFVSYFGYKTLSEISNNEKKEKYEELEDSRSLEELLEDLDKLVGLKNVKEKIRELIAYQKVQKLREESNLKTNKNTLHIAFTGNPGTGKTTVARIVGRIYKQLGLLSKGHFIEVSRTDLIAGYQGQTALKVREVIDKAKGGVLFIDEAYSITENEQSDSYGRECLTELTKALEDYRDDLVVIVAGYTKPMEKFFQSNPGLKSRFNTFIEFEDYNIEELESIFQYICQRNEYQLDLGAEDRLKEIIEKELSKKDEEFSNARMIRNLYDDLIMNHAKRVAKIENPSKEELSLIRLEDF
ncbi:MAG: AAA family ATPase [Gemella sp.]|nr:AAA family ATPase [Gemella sp.]